MEEGQRGEDLKVTGELRQAARKQQLLARVVHLKVAARKVLVGDFQKSLPGARGECAH